MATQKKKSNNKPETSKEIVIAVQAIFVVSMVASYTLPILLDYINELALKMFQTIATLTGSVLIGYYGKAGFENYDKHKKLLHFIEDDDDTGEGGNG